MKKFHLVFVASLAVSSNLYAMDSATFATDFNSGSVASITLDASVSLSNSLNPRSANLDIDGGGYTLTMGGNTMTFSPGWNDSITASLTDITVSGATNGAAVFNFSGTGPRAFTISGSSFSNNAGGAVYASGQIQGTNAAGLQIFNTSFSGNSAANGGAVYFASNNSQNTGANNPAFKLYTGSGLSISGNTAAANGGALYLLASGGNNAQNYFEIDNYAFSGNSAGQYGGAIYNGILNPNKADSSQPATNKFSITGNSFTGNSALYGGAIATTINGGNGDNEIDIGASGDSFSGNTATGGYGGAIYNAVGDQYSPYGGTVLFNTNGVYSGNSAGYGGAIYNYLARGNADIQFNVYGTYQNNSASANGGAIYNNASNYSGVSENAAQMNIHTGARFIGNTAAQQGGAMYNNGVGILNIDSTMASPVIFNGNRASVNSNNNGTPSTLGDDIYQASSGATINFTGSGIVAMSGGFGGFGTINMLGTGLLYLSGVSDPNGIAAMFGLTGASDNSGFSGTFNLNSGLAYIDGIMFGGTNNIYGNSNTPTALLISSPRESIYFNLNLWNNANFQFMSSNPGAVEIRTTVGGYGPGLAFLGAGAAAEFSGLPTAASGVSYYMPVDIYNGALGAGGYNSIAFFNSDVTFGDTNYNHNTVYQFSQGSTIDLAASSSTYQNYEFFYINAADSFISFKVASATDGGIGAADTITTGGGSGSLSIGRVYINDSLGLIGNGAEARIITGGSLTLTDSGAAQYIVASGNVYNVSVSNDNLGIVFNNVTDLANPPSIGDVISGNVTIDDGNGGTTTIDTGSSVGVQVGDNDTIAGGTTVAGGGDSSIYGQTPGDNSGSSIVVDNSGSDSALVVNQDNTNLNVSDVNVSGADSSGSGGVINVDNGSSSVNVSNVDANNNQTTGDGGVINITDGSVSVDGSDFTNNTAGGSGGAINADGGSLVVSGGSFDGNSATDGGAISSGSGSADLSVSNGASFTDNTATDNGGAIYNDGTLNLVSNDGNDIVFSSNSAGTSGDDIYNASDTSVININGNGGKVVIGGGDDDKGGIGGTGQINKSGDGTLELGAGSDSSDFTGSFAQSGGTTDVQGGFFGGTSVIGGGILVWDGADASKDSGATLIITDNGNLAVINGGTLDLNNAGDSIAGGAAIFVDGGSTLELSNSGATATINGNDVILGNLEMSDGNIIFDGAPGALANYDQTGGTATITGGADLTLSPSVVISGGNIVIDGGTLNTGGQIINLAAGGNGDGSLTLSNGGRLNAIDGITNDNNFAGSLTVSGNNYIGIDLNAATGQSDQFIFAGAAQGAPSGTLILDDINFVGKAPTQEQIVFTVVSAGSYDNSLSFAAAEKSFMSPILEYRLDSLGDGKYALDKSGYNPTIFRGAAASVSAFNTQLMTMDAVYAHIYQDSMEHRSDGYMGWQQREERGTVWAKGYGMAGNIDAGQGADMKSAAYGIVAGLDLAPWRHANYGTRFMPSLYMALSGASADYSGASISQSSLQLGAVGTLTYGNLQLSALGYAGKIYNSMQVMGADDKTDGWIYGASAEVAYFANLGGGWELAPNVRAVYGSISAQNWHSDYGDIDISAKQLNGLAIAPGINVMYALSGWNLFAGGQYVKNFGVSAAGMAESISLPKIKLPDFAELSFGGNVRLGQSWLLDAKVAVRAGDGVSGFGGQLGATWRF